MNMPYTRQQGLSMIELLVALALSSILILGISQIYLDNKRSYLFQQSQAINLDSARFADYMLSDLLGKAGYQRSSNQQELKDFPASTELDEHCAAFAAGHAVASLKSGQGLCLRYQPAVHEELSCASNSQTLTNKNAFTKPDNGEIIYIALKFVPDPDAPTKLENGVIQCIDKENGTADLINGVADLRIEFGVGKEDPDKALRDSAPWVLSSAWTASMGPVRAVRYSVLLASAPNQRDGDSAVFTRWINTQATDRKTLLQSNDQRRIYQIATGSQALRNLSL